MKTNEKSKLSINVTGEPGGRGFKDPSECGR